MVGLIALLALCAVPHIVRASGDDCAPRDGMYVHAALMLSKGYEPYVHFTQVAFPLAEAVLAAVITVAGPTLPAVEWTTNAVILLTALALFVAVRRSLGLRPAVIAALLWSWGLWVVHFNLFERETWAALGTSLALLAYAPLVAARADADPGPDDDDEARARPGPVPLDWPRAARIALALGLAFTIKITAVMPAAGLCLHRALVGDLRGALRLGLLYSGLIGAATLSASTVWGRPFLEQVYMFGFFRQQTHDVLGAWGEVVAHLDHTLLLGFVGLVTWAPRRGRGLAGAAALVLLMDLLYATVISPTLWDHNLLNLFPACAVLGAGLVDALLRPGRGRLRLAALGVAGLLVLAVVFGSRPYMAGEYGPRGPGFGGRAREGLERRAELIAMHTGPDEIVECIMPWWAFVADRVKFVRYWDLAPVALGVEASLRADGWSATFAKRHDALLLGPGLPPPPKKTQNLQAYAARLMACSLTYIRPELLDALQRRELGLILEPLPPGVLTERDLWAAGYQPFEQWGLRAWKPQAGSRPAVRELHQR